MIWSFRTNGNYVDFIHTDETDLHEEILVHRLHNTSRCIDWSLPVDTTRISFTIDETRYENVSIYDIDFDGTAMNVQGDFETGIIEMFPGLAGGGEGGGVESLTAGDASISVGGTATEPTVKLPYLVYVALLSQSGEDDPVATVLTNTLSDVIVWNRDAQGFFSGTLTGAFPAGKTICFSEINYASQIGTEVWSSLGRLGNNEVDLVVKNSSFADTDGFVGLSVEIRVYP